MISYGFREGFKKYSSPVQSFISRHLSTPPIKSADWQVSYSLETSKLISEIEKNRIENIFDLHLKKIASPNLEMLSYNILEDSQYNKIHLYFYHPYKISISLSKHIPLLKLTLGNAKCVSNEGVVYGSCADKDMPEVFGVLDQPIHVYKKINKNELIVSEKESDLIKECIELYKKSLEENLNFNLIEFKKYRGFSITLKNSNTEVSFGKPPFQGKIKKLRKILYTLASKGKTASRIELDFEDKAFVKEYTL